MFAGQIFSCSDNILLNVHNMTKLVKATLIVTQPISLTGLGILSKVYCLGKLGWKLGKIDCWCKMCSIYSSSVHCHGSSCKINEVIVLVFERQDMWLFLGIVFSPLFQNLFFSKI